MGIDGYTKLFSSIVTSTIWSEDSDTRVVWITLLALADANGFVASTVPGLARLSGVSLEACESALAKFQQPDKYSRSHDYNGRRIVLADGGFELLNHQKYRELRNEDDRRLQNREAQRRHRSRNKPVSNCQQSKQWSAQAEAEAEAETRELAKRKRGRPRSAGLSQFPEGWVPTEAHAKRATETGLNLAFEAGKFESYHRSKGSLFACWNSAFTTWLMNAKKFADDRQQSLVGDSKEHCPL